MDLYSDGGVCGANPSAVGGMWAYCQVVNGEVRGSDSHVITPSEVGLPTVSNNVAELYAAIRALESVNPRSAVVLYTDSLVTLRRVADPLKAKFNGVPDHLRERLIAAAQRLGDIRLVLVAGHPTRDELAQGFKNKNRLPVSKFNVICDKMCNEARDLHEPALRLAMAEAGVTQAEAMLSVAKTIRDVEMLDVK